MSEENPLLSYTDLVNEIKNYCDNLISGTLLIATETNVLIRMILDEGKITAMICGTRNGMDVIPDLQSITAGRVKFSASKMGANKGDPLPTTQEILGLLQSSLGGVAKPEAALASAVAPAVNVNGTQVSAVLDIVEQELIEFLGPMGSIVWEEHMGKMQQPLQSADVKTLINSFSKEIGDSEKIVTFKKRIKEKVDNL